jgi:hypothetical protein
MTSVLVKVTLSAKANAALLEIEKRTSLPRRYALEQIIFAAQNGTLAQVNNAPKTNTPPDQDPWFPKVYFYNNKPVSAFARVYGVGSRQRGETERNPHRIKSLAEWREISADYPEIQYEKVWTPEGREVILADGIAYYAPMKDAQGREMLSDKEMAYPLMTQEEVIDQGPILPTNSDGIFWFRLSDYQSAWYKPDENTMLINAATPVPN